MSKTLNTDPTERATYPFAVSTRMPDQTEPTVVHFKSKAAADFYASLMDGDVNNVKRFVALHPSEPLAPSDNGWREVSYFAL